MASAPAISSSDDDDDVWIPLIPEASASVSKPMTSAGAPISGGQAKQDTPSATLHSTQPRQPIGLGGRKDTPSTPGAKSIDEIQRKLETKVCLKRNLIDHPIDQFWRGFLANLGRELWRLDLNIRVGLSLVLVGFTLNSLSFVTWFLWSPRLVFLAMLCIVPLMYLDPFDVKPQFEAIGKILVSPGQIVEAAEQLQPGQLRRLCLVLLMYPTALEIYTISFLTNVQVESGWALFTLLIVGFNLVFMMFLLKLRHWGPRDCIHNAGLLILYGSALLIVIVKTDMRRMPHVAGPFCSATGTLLLTYRDDDMEWMSRTIRFALRLTLRDVLASISEKVNEDEMLQLAMLRWIVDYWAYVPTASPTPTPQRRKSSDDSDQFTTNESTQSNTTSTREDFPTTANQSASPRHQDVPWEELQPMLNMTTDQMAEEVDVLQSGATTDRTQDTASEPSTSTSPRGATRPSSSSNPDSCDDGNDSLRNLKAMLITLDVDERGRPAVMAYKRAVEAFPPTQKLAIFISVARRCPALLTLMLHYAIGSPSLVMRVIVLLPFMILEYFRIEAWKAACLRLADMETVVTSEGNVATEQLLNVDAMTLLLSGDHDYSFRPPTLLLVWRNVVSSVAALEVGLTATRCLQTTTVAVQFAGNIMSLAQLGYEISQFGLLHGLGVMAKEVMFMHTAEPSSEDDRAQNMRYAGAAMNAVENGKFVLRNMEVILQDEHLKPVLGQVVGFLSALSGHGWLWGKEQPTSADEASVRQTEPNTSSREATSSKDTEPQDTHTTKRRRRSVRFSDDEIEETKEQVGDSALSSVMELLSQAHEQGCIDIVEKNEICEKLAKLSKEERENPAVIKGMTRSLEVALEADSIESRAQPALYADSGHAVESTPMLDMSEIAHARSVIVDVSNIKQEELRDPAEVACMRLTQEALIQQDVDAGNNSITVVSDDSAVQLNSGPELVRICGSEKLNVSSLSNDTSDVTMDQDEVKLAERSKGGNGTDFAATNIGENSIQPAIVDKGVGEVHGESDDKKNDALIKFGIAAFGVVVGGVFLALQGGKPNNDSDKKGRTDEQTNVSSTVQIEQLSDDGEDEWVSVAPSRSS